MISTKTLIIVGALIFLVAVGFFVKSMMEKRDIEYTYERAEVYDSPSTYGSCDKVEKKHDDNHDDERLRKLEMNHSRLSTEMNGIKEKLNFMYQSHQTLTNTVNSMSQTLFK